MMGTVIVVHVLAVAIYRLAGLARQSERTVQLFGAVWTAVTVAVVGVGLFRVRAARVAARAARRRATLGSDLDDSSRHP